MQWTRRAALTQLAVLGSLHSALSHAQEGTDAIKLVVPLPPGSGGDNIARILAPHMRSLLNRPMVIDNRPGGDMMIAATQVAKAAADGRTLMMAHLSSMVLNPLVYPTMAYHPAKDFVPIGKISETPGVVVVNPAVPARTLGEFVTHARNNPGRLSYGTAILVVQVSGEQLVHTRRLQITRVPYKGGAQLMQDTVAHHIDMSIADTSSYLALIRAGKLRALATTGRERVSLLPDVPTVREAGFPEMEIAGWWGMFAPAKTPRAQVERIEAALQRTLAMPDVVQQLAGLAATPRPLTGAQLAREMREQTEHWRSVLPALKIRTNE